jgi:choline monooxygenase
LENIEMSVSLTDIAEQGQIEAFEASGPLARGLPSFAYVNSDFYRLEQEKLFPNAWVCVGFAHDLAKTGEATPVNVAGRPVVLVRNEAGEIKAFHNVCRHRCMKLVDQPMNVGKLFKCPYHAWAYDLSGKLRAAPHFGGIDNQKPESFDFEDHGLIPVPCEVWGEWIFVNLNGNAGNLSDHVAPMANRLEGIDLEDLRLVGVLDFGEVSTNWKFLMENFIEPYHVPVVHPSTTDQPLKDHYVVNDWPCLGSAVDISRQDGDEGREGSLNVSSRYLTLFPNFVLGRYFPDQLGVHLNLPVSENKVHQYRAIYKTDGTDASVLEAEQLMNLWWDVHKEDHDVCERLQQGRASDVSAQGGVLSPCWESSVHSFQKMVIQAVK